MFKLTKTTTYSGDGVSLNGSASVVTDGCDKRDISLDAESVDVQVDIPIDASQTKGVLLLADQDVTIKVNSASVPDSTIELTAGRDLGWLDGQGTSPFASDVTSLFVTSTNAATLRIWIYTDATPA